MKRTYFSILVFLFGVTNVYSQLQVDSIGYVGIGITDEMLEDEEADSIMSPFAVLTAGDESMTASFGNSSLHRYYVTLDSENDQNSNYSGIALRGYSSTNYGYSTGVLGYAMSSPNSENPSIGTKGTSWGGSNSVGVYGSCYHPYASYSSDISYAGIYGSDGVNTPTFIVNGLYAGYFRGKVRVTDTLFVQSLHIQATSSNGSNNDRNISVSLIGEEERITDKLRNISSIELQHSEPVEVQRQTSPIEAFLNGKEYQNLTKREKLQLDSICSTTVPAEKNPLASVNYGLDAEQLKAMFPKLVQQDKKGNYSINYIEIIPLLVKSINELSEELEELKGTSKNRAKAQSETTNIEETVSDVDMVRMDQNKPNPFSESTVIGLNIPEKTQKANIFIYDLSGKQVQNVQVNERGETNITVYASELGAGMYIYTLVIDGKVVVTRRMIVE